MRLSKKKKQNSNTHLHIYLQDRFRIFYYILNMYITSLEIYNRLIPNPMLYIGHEINLTNDKSGSIWFSFLIQQQEIYPSHLKDPEKGLSSNSLKHFHRK